MNVLSSEIITLKLNENDYISITNIENTKIW